MTYNYKLENYSPEYANLMERRAKITESLDQATETMKGIDQRESAAKEAWLQAEVAALLDPKKASLVDKAHRQYHDIKAERKQLADRIEIMKRAGDQIKAQTEDVKENAKLQALNAALADHQKAVSKSLKILRELAKAQQEELAISNALSYVVGYNSRLLPTYGMTVYLGSEQVYGEVMHRLVMELGKRGYDVK